MSADLLRRAVDLIERRAAEATFDRYEAVENYPGSWQVHAVGPELRPPPHKGIRNPQQDRFSVAEESQDGDIREGDAHWMAMLGPQVAVPLASWLRSAADDAAMVEATNERACRDGTYVVHSAWVGRACAFARAVLGEVSDG